ncbi:MAG TPA: glycosyltransferase [Candidatus Paceibacterota bacterium]|jgi:glycosyltransferase involved in cell wall biosynthesis|nr:glycosyltransferase [Candidatus Paceibacterota bacterium]
MDRDDTTLGFFPLWVDELAHYFEHIEVIALGTGVYDLPAHVSVHSLGKEHGAPPLRKLVYTLRLYKLAWRLRPKYDAVFVHQGQEFLLVAGLLWRLLGKPTYLWRNHYEGSVLTALAGKFTRKVFYTSRYSYTASFANAKQMPVGVRTDARLPEGSEAREERSILSLGRISPSKNLHVIIEALGILHKKGVAFVATMRGKTEPEDEPYLESLKRQVQELGIEPLVRFGPGVPNPQTPALYRSHKIFVNASGSGMLDKAIFTASASGCAVVACSQDWAQMVDERFTFPEGDANALAQRLEALLNLSEDEQKKAGLELREMAVGKHSLSSLARALGVQMGASVVE